MDISFVKTKNECYACSPTVETIRFLEKTLSVMSIPATLRHPRQAMKWMTNSFECSEQHNSVDQ